MLYNDLPILNVNRHSPLLVSQIRTVQSRDADASHIESYEKATEVTTSRWPSKV